MIYTIDVITNFNSGIYSMFVGNDYEVTYAMTITRCIKTHRDDDVDYSTMTDSKAIVAYFKLEVLWRYEIINRGMQDELNKLMIIKFKNTCIG